VSCTCSLADMPLCSKGHRLASNAQIQHVMKQRLDSCLLLDAIKRYPCAVQLTSPTVSIQKPPIIVSKVDAVRVSYVEPLGSLQIICL